MGLPATGGLAVALVNLRSMTSEAPFGSSTAYFRSTGMVGAVHWLTGWLAGSNCAKETLPGMSLMMRVPRRATAVMPDLVWVRRVSGYSPAVAGGRSITVAVRATPLPDGPGTDCCVPAARVFSGSPAIRSEEHTSELQSLMRI